MHLFGLSFISFLFKLSYGPRFWNNIRNNEFMLYKRVTSTKCLAKKLKKHELDLGCLITSRDEGVCPKFTRWKNLKTRSIKEKNKFSRQILLDSKRKAIKSLQEQNTTSMNDLLSSTTLFKGYVLKISINRSVLKEEKKIIKRHRKKLDTLLEERDKNREILTNPNTIITNLSNHVLTEGEYDVLQYKLKHGLATRPKENDILAYAEDIWEQIDKTNICNNNFRSKSKSEIALQGMTFNLINIEDSRICKDTNHIKVIKQLRKDIAILKPDKDNKVNGVVLLNNKGYTTSAGSLFKNTRKFKSLDSDPTIKRMETLQSYLNTLHKRNELTKEEYNTMRPKNGKLARAHGLPKIHKEYNNIPKFRPIVIPQVRLIIRQESF